MTILTSPPSRRPQSAILHRIQLWLPPLAFALLLTAGLAAILPPLPAAAAGTCYVDAGAGGAATGLNWTDAYTTVQDALSNAACTEIWAAAGVYYPDEGAGQTDDDRTSTFALTNGAALYGGFAGTESQRSQRDPAANVTVLSGDIDQNDTTDANGVVTATANITGTNVYHVVTGSGTDSTAVLDGFTVTAGQANGGAINDYGGGLYNDTGSPTLTDVTFSGNSAAYRGGGMSNYQSSPALTNVTFSGNSASDRGGGMYSTDSSPALAGVTFSGNSAADGGGMYNNSSSPTLTHVTFSANSASHGSGGGMYNINSNSPTLMDVTFSANSAFDYGGGMYNSTSSPALTDVTFSANSALYGGGIFNNSSNPTLTDVTFSANSASSDGGGIYNYSSSPALTNVTFSGNAASVNGGGMVNNTSSPTLTNTIIANSTNGGDCTGDNVAAGSSNNLIEDSTHACGLVNGTDGNIIGSDPNLGALIDYGGPGKQVFPLLPGSLAVDAGINTNCPASDQRGAARPVDGNSDHTAACDIGAFELGYHLTLSKQMDNPTPVSGQTITFTLIVANTDLTVTNVLISDTLPAGLNFLGPITLEPAGAGSVGAAPPILVSGLTISSSQRITVTFPVTVSWGLATRTPLTNTAAVSATQLLTPTRSSAVVTVAGTCYVDASASGAASGLNWSDAYLTVQDALSDATCAEIWVAAGVYYPDEGAGQTNNDRASTFALTSGAALYGGFNGTETARSQRDPAANLTILSGDIDQNDTDANGNHIAETTADLQGNNAYHVVTGSGTNNTAVLDGFTITAGQANGGSGDNYGGGMYNDTSSPALTDVTFSGNLAAYRGGGMSNYNSSPALTDVTFSGNSASDRGGGIYNSSSNLALTNVTFSANSSANGGGMFNYRSSPALTNATFSANSATNGGGIYNDSSNPALTNVTFSANSASRSSGGGMLNSYSSPTLTNVIIANSTNGMDCVNGTNASIAAGSANNLIGNRAHACGLMNGTNGNITGSDPKLGPLTDYGGSGKQVFPLLAGSPAIDAGANATCPATDQRGTARPVGASCDIGAFEPRLAISKRVDNPAPVPGQTVTFTLIVANPGPLVTNGLLSDSLPAGLNFLGPVTLEPAGAGTVGTAPPALVSNLTINSNQRITVTFPVTVSLGIAARTSLTNTAAISATQVPTPTRASAGVTVARICYVDADASGAASGLNWADSYLTVQDALADAACTEVWAADGVYYPDEGIGQTDNVITSTFVLTNGVALYGGFNGTETARSQRDPAANITVLSGDIDQNDTTGANGVVTDTTNIAGANAYHVVTGSGTDNTAVLDGFTVTAGQANGGAVNDYGGGMYNDGSNHGESNPTLNNVIFSGNSAGSGGGMFNDGTNYGDSSPALNNVTFSGNSSSSHSIDGGGGGMYNDGDDYGNSSPALNNVTFSGNSAGSGGGIYDHGGLHGNSSPALNNVTFSNNSAGLTGSGGGMYNNSDYDGKSSPSLINVTFSGNSAGYGGGMYNRAIYFRSESSPTLTDVTFDSNFADSSGGGMYNHSNHAGKSSPTLVNVTFSNNSLGTFHGLQGGGMYNLSDGAGESSPSLTNVTFSGNSAGGGGLGGGMRNSSYQGGKSSPRLTNVTFSGNSASAGGGISNYSSGYRSVSSPHLTNVIIANNSGGDCVGDGLDASSSNNLIEDNSSACGLINGANGNIVGSDPNLGALADNGGETQTFALLSGSPAIDAGTDSGGAPSTDQRGAARPQGAEYDIGAYELDTFSLVITQNADNAVPLPGQTITFTVVVTNPGPLVTNGLLSDTLPAGLNFLGPITLEPSRAGNAGAAPPVLASGLTISNSQHITVTFPVTVSYGLTAGTMLTNTVAISATEITTPTQSSTVVTVGNASPAADAGTPQTVAPGDSVTLDGSASSDPNGDALTYLWQQTGGSAATLSDSSAVSPTFTAPITAGTVLTFTLSVTDTGGLTDTAVTTVTVSNVAPAADVGSSQTVNPGDSVTLDGSASSDPNGDALTYLWQQTGGVTVTLSGATTVSPTFTAPQADGVLTFSLTVTDTGGLTDTAVTTVTVKYRIYLPLVLKN